VCWLTNLSGQASILLATTSDQAADLARRARDELAALGLSRHQRPRRAGRR